ncbi:MAG: hypothetical protein ACI9AQ_002032, partial [Dinoroseobacter sp.]
DHIVGHWGASCGKRFTVTLLTSPLPGNSKRAHAAQGRAPV